MQICIIEELCLILGTIFLTMANMKVDNPFIITEKVIPEYFCDRVKESSQLIKLLRNGNNVVLISQRRIGKTGLIQFCFEQPDLKDHFLTIYLDILSTTNLQEFTFLLGREVFDTIRTKGEKLWKSFVSVVKSLAGKITIDPLTGVPAFNLQLGDIARPEYTLKEIFEYLSSADRPYIVAIDEFQQIVEYPEKNVEALLRSHLLQINNCRMIFSGSKRDMLANMFSKPSRPFYQSAAFLQLSVIPEDVYVEFIIRMFKGKGKSIPEELARKVYRLMGGITFNTQRLCNGIFANTARGAKASDEIMEYSLDEIISSYDVIFRLRMSELTIRQKELLVALSKEEVTEKITAADFIKNNALASTSAVQTAIKALLKNSLVIKTDEGYRIDDCFFRIWLQRNY